MTRPVHGRTLVEAHREAMLARWQAGLPRAGFSRVIAGHDERRPDRVDRHRRHGRHGWRHGSRAGRQGDRRRRSAADPAAAAP